MTTTEAPRGVRRPAADIARGAVQEARSRRLLLIGVVVSVVFVALFGLAIRLTLGEATSSDELEMVATHTILTVLGLYAVQFLASFLALLLGSATVAGELDSGRALPVLARPLSRRSWLLQRMAAFGGLAAGYVAIMAVGLLLVSALVAGYAALSPVTGVALLLLQAVVMLATASMLSTRLSATAAASITAALFGLAWLGGIAEFIGGFTDNDAIARLGVAISLVMPSDAVWQGASYYLSSPLWLATAGGVGDVPPFMATQPPSALRIAWAVLHALVTTTIAVRWLDRRDL